MWKRVFWGVLTLLTVANLSALAFWIHQKYAEPPMPPPPDPRMVAEIMRENLGLSAEQAREIQAAHKAFRQQIDPLAHELRQVHRTLLDEILLDQPRRTKIDSLVQEIDTKRHQLDVKLIEGLLQHKRFLTPEQQKQFFRMVMMRIAEGEQGGPHRMRRMNPNLRRR